jgi:hypothetical protein
LDRFSGPKYQFLRLSQNRPKAVLGDFFGVNTHKYIHNDHKTYPNPRESDLGLLPKTRWWAQNWASAYHQNRLSQNRLPAVLGVFIGFNTLKMRQNRPRNTQNDPKTPKNHIEIHFGSSGKKSSVELFLFQKHPNR